MGNDNYFEPNEYDTNMPQGFDDTPDDDYLDWEDASEFEPMPQRGSWNDY